MSDEIEDLKKEIIYLRKRIDVLERSERKRNASKSIKIMIKIILWVCIIIGVLKAYDYVKNEIPNMISEKVDNVTLNIKDKVSSIIP